MTIANTATEYRDLPLSILTESQTNPRRIFEESALKESARVGLRLDEKGQWKVAVFGIGVCNRHSMLSPWERVSAG